MRRLILLLASFSSLFSSQAPEEQATFKTSIDMVTVPVVVRDAQGHAVGNLRQENFQLSDSGKAQVITKFSVEQSGETAGSRPPEAASAPPPPAAMPDRFVAYLIDDLHMEARDLIGARTALASHLRADIRPGDRYAILTTSGQAGTEFTNDQEKLQAALSRLVARPMHSSHTGCPNLSLYEADRIINRNDSTTTDAKLQETIICMQFPARGDPSDSAMATSIMMAKARSVLLEGEQQVRLGLGALQNVVKRMGTVPGQRTIVLVSAGFLKLSLQREMSAIVQMAIRSSVVINALDARGLWADSGPEPGEYVGAEIARINATNARAVVSEVTDAVADLAIGAGGTFFNNSNDLAGGLREVAARPRYTYVLGFSPPNLKHDGKYHTLKVSLKGLKGMRVEARKGYFAPNSYADPAQQAKQEIQDSIFSRDERNDLKVEVFAQVTTARDLAGAKTLARIAMFTHLDLRSVELRKVSGRYRNAIQIVSALFDFDGNLMDGRAQSLDLSVSDADLEKTRAAGLTARVDFDVKPGAYVIRTVVRTLEGRITIRNSPITISADGRVTGQLETAAAQPAEGKQTRSARRSSNWTPTQAPPPEPEEIEEPVSPGIDRVEVPGGLAAAFAMARLEGVPTEGDFFLRYCRAIAASLTGLGNRLSPYFRAAAELSVMAERGGSGRVNLSLNDDAARKTTVQALAFFGWNVTEVGDTLVYDGREESGARKRYRIEPADQPADGVRQEIPAALGVDALAMVNTLAAGGTFPVAFPSGKADFIQAHLWTKLLGGLPSGGFAELFAERPQLAGFYAGLAAMGPDAAAAVISGLKLRALAEKYADVVALYGESFGVSEGRVVVPGGPEAELVWEKLVGAAPRDPKAFFRALVRKDQGRLAAFYHAVWRGDAARQSFFTRNLARAERFYQWYRDSEELRAGTPTPQTGHWRRDLFCGLPLDENGAVRFPGGPAAWNAPAGADDAALLALPRLVALVPVAKIEEARKTPLDSGSAALLAARYESWREIFPYFEKLPGLGHAEFEALASFEKTVSARPASAQEAILAEWHSLVKVIELASCAGTLAPTAAAHAFRRACEAGAAPDHSRQAVNVLREMVGGAANLDEAVPGRLLALSAERRAAYDRVIELQHTPKLASLGRGTDRSQRTRAALGGIVYAALLEPDRLVVAEDPALLARQKFVNAMLGCKLFCSSRPSISPGKVAFLGGFANFEESARLIARERIGLSADPEPAAAAPASAGPVADFRTTTRLVEVYATVADGSGRYTDGLGRADFSVFDNREPVSVAAFENNTAAVSVALLLDASASMTDALATLRKSAFALAGHLRPADSVAVYSFSDRTSELQDWTTDKDAAKRAILGVRLQNATELHDALFRVIRELAERPGKKAIVVFSDGDDTASALDVGTVIRRAKQAGIPVYTIAHGEALTHPGLLEQLEKIATATGGLTFAIRERSEIGRAFERISEDLSHGYLLAFRPEEDPTRAWHRIRVTVRGKERQVRAREGYYPE